MDFMEYLQNRHNLIKGVKEIGKNSARQYNNRLKNLKGKKIYNGEQTLNDQMLVRIKSYYKDTTNHYPRTIEYYIEFLKYNNQLL
ncbi:hypothetical protein ACJ2A9_21955 [Anaerobacillus sp. MEB173]|uniref:hypothetical protein n=1 Tax=Anaerobacillus sp. MEB173 TaxID=3383345 RepID=UPI003F8DEA3A